MKKIPFIFFISLFALKAFAADSAASQYICITVDSNPYDIDVQEILLKDTDNELFLIFSKNEPFILRGKWSKDKVIATGEIPSINAKISVTLHKYRLGKYEGTATVITDGETRKSKIVLERGSLYHPPRSN